MSRIWASIAVLAAAVSSVAFPDAVSAQNLSTTVADPAVDDAPIEFDIPMQPLAAALKLFSQRSNFSVMAQSSLLDRRMSNAVRGAYSPSDALRRLLSGSGLDARFPSPRAVAIVPSTAAALAPDAAATPPSFEIAESEIDGIHRGGADYGAYVASMQAALTGTLCRSPLTRPGAYRLAVQLRIGSKGGVSELRIAGSTGDATRDAAIERAIRSVTFDAPPGEMPQPVTILLRPAESDVVPGCTPPNGN